jgi:hypothetical protein
VKPNLRVPVPKYKNEDIPSLPNFTYNKSQSPKNKDLKVITSIDQEKKQNVPPKLLSMAQVNMSARIDDAHFVGRKAREANQSNSPTQKVKSNSPL